MRAKTAHTFAACLKVKVVGFDIIGLVKLAMLFLTPEYASLVQELVFLPVTNNISKSDANMVKRVVGGPRATGILGDSVYYAEEVRYLIFAFQRLENIKPVIIGRLVQGLYPASVR